MTILKKPINNRKVNLKPVYEEISEAEKFREQYRFIFAGALVALVFAAPSGNVLELLLKATLGFSAFFAALYLICTAANVKYKEPGLMYGVWYVSERFRRTTFDLSVDVFAFAVFYFFGLLAVGLINSIPGVELNGVEQWLIIFITVIILASGILLLSSRLKQRDVSKGEV